MAEGQATTMQIIADAQAIARATLVSPDSNVQGQIDFGTAVTQRIQFQEEKRQSNIGAVVSLAAAELEGKEVEDHERTMIGLLASSTISRTCPLKTPSSFMPRSLLVRSRGPEAFPSGHSVFLRNLDQATAGLFRNFCSLSVSIRLK